MERWKNKLFYALAGTTSGLTGLVSSSSCSGGSCPSCFKCVGVGTVIILLVFYNNLKSRRTEESCGSQKPIKST